MRILGLLVLCAIAACTKQEEASHSESATFEFVHGLDADAEVFRASTSDPATIESVRAELKRPMSERVLHINGAIAAGGEGNPPWKWHFVQSQWSLAELSIELCDGRPSYVDENLDEWLKTVGSYCPWSSRVAREL